ncbi:radical SAM protein [Actinokineospora enzanensis]|uniref:radical SAM protein n=1 Tax=Actinokineospora enzanensis TaxID=155975 RepID=UPI000371D573|nr:radical SAM protein [Actinokineospora enzanensis]
MATRAAVQPSGTDRAVPLGLPGWMAPQVPEVDQWNIILTNRCNLHCISCSYPDQRPFRYVRRETIARYLPRMLDHGVRRVMLTGGEPCMHPDFDDIVDDLAAADVDITLVTNGTYLGRKLPRLAGKLARLIISLDSDTADGYASIRGASAFDHLTGLPARFRKESPDTHLTLCVLTQRLNFRRLPEFVELAAGLGVDHVSFLVPDVAGMVAPTERGGAFGHVAALPDDRVEQVALTDAEVEEFRERVIPAVEAACARHPELTSSSLDLLRDFADYFAAFRTGRARPERRRCALPFREVVLDEQERFRFCFFMPDAWPAAGVEDPVNHPGVVAARRDYLETDHRLDRFCNMCLQARRVEAAHP